MRIEYKRLKDCCSKIGSGATPKGGSSVYIDSGVSLIRSQNVYNLKFSYSGLAHINDEAANKLKGVIVNKGDVLLNITGDSVARTCVVPDEVLPARVNQHVSIIRPNKDVDSRYLNYYLASPAMQGYLLNIASTGASRNAITKGMIEKLVIPFPDMDSQRRIASILSVYDNLIENNNKRIRLLEQMAENLYKEWFVRFRFPGHENAEFENGLPKGWGMERIGNVCETIGGGTPSTSKTEYWNGGIKWVTPSDITSKNSLPLLKVEVSITEEGLKNSSAKLLPPYTILMTSRASIGFFGVAPFEVCTNQGFISIIPQNDNLRMYMLYMLKSRKDEIIANANGSTFLEISKGRFRKMKMVVPSNIILDLFENKTRTIFDETLKLEQQNTTLTRQRDLLLPRLMSGKLEVNI